MKVTKTERLSGAMTLTWLADGSLAAHLFSYFEEEYERTDTGHRTPIYKMRNTPCKDLVIIELVGYSQGDYAIVKTTKDNDTPEYRKYLNHIFWDAPVQAHMDICGSNQEFDLMEYYGDAYDTSKEALISAIELCFKNDEEVKERALALCKEFGDYAEHV